MGEWIAEGQPAPELGLQDDAGRSVRLADFRGRPVVLYFYPKDDTPGCTREACAFRDRRDELARRGATVLGVSPDGVASHARFRDKHGLDFPLLADPDHRVAEAYGAWRQKTLYGRKSIGIQRSTFLIDGDGVVRRVWRKVQVDGHDGEVLAALEQLAGRVSA
jgi:peroxiredoxin Q/BCP